MLTDYVGVKAKMYTDFPAKFSSTLFENVCFIYESRITDQNPLKSVVITRKKIFQFSNARLKAGD